MTTTLFIILFMVAIPLGWEMYAILGEPITISRAFQQLGQEWNAFTIYALSVLVGHFFVQPPAEYTLAGTLSETSEVVIVTWLGWCIFLLFRTHRHWLPLPWYVSLGIIVGSVLVGAFAWTISA